jgi:hypothetical protein
MDNTIVQSGRFTSDGVAKFVNIRSDVDWMWVYNWTQAATQQATGRGVKFYWQRGMSTDTGIEYKKTNATDALNMVTLASGGFTLFEQDENTLGPLTALTSISNGNPPVVTVASTAALNTGDIVRLINVTGGQQISSIPFNIEVLSGTTFSLRYMPAIAATTTGFYRRISRERNFDPRGRYITSITQANPGVFRTSILSGWEPGEVIRFHIPDPVFGMQELDGRTATITAVNTTTNEMTFNIDTSSFTAFTFPTTTQVPFSPAFATPVGEAASEPYANLLDDATFNSNTVGMRLAAGAQSPAGSSGDLIYWVAGKSFSVTNE